MLSAAAAAEASDDVDEIDDSHPDSNDVFAAYLADLGGIESHDREIVRSPEIGLCIEKIKDGFSLDSLWQVQMLCTELNPP